MIWRGSRQLRSRCPITWLSQRSVCVLSRDVMGGQEDVLINAPGKPEEAARSKDLHLKRQVEVWQCCVHQRLASQSTTWLVVSKNSPDCFSRNITLVAHLSTFLALKGPVRSVWIYLVGQPVSWTLLLADRSLQ